MPCAVASRLDAWPRPRMRIGHPPGSRRRWGAPVWSATGLRWAPGLPFGSAWHWAGRRTIAAGQRWAPGLPFGSAPAADPRVKSRDVTQGAVAPKAQGRFAQARRRPPMRAVRLEHAVVAPALAPKRRRGGPAVPAAQGPLGGHTRPNRRGIEPACAAVDARLAGPVDLVKDHALVYWNNYVKLAVAAGYAHAVRFAHAGGACLGSINSWRPARADIWRNPHPGPLWRPNRLALRPCRPATAAEG